MLDGDKLYQEKPLAVDVWPADIRRDLERNKHNPCVGSMLVEETDRVRVWILSIPPGQSAPFHRHVLDYFWVAMSAGRGRHYYADGRVVDLDYEEGDTKQLHFGADEFMVHNAMNIGDTDLKFVTVEFVQSTNTPLPLPKTWSGNNRD